jgi:hypothetical protein
MKRVTGVMALPALMMAASLVASQAMAGVIDERLAAYQAEGATAFSVERGKDMWFQSYDQAQGEKSRSCTSCHTTNVRVNGKHATTGKPIKAMAPSINPERFTDAAKIEKWFKRNCKWTMDRECTPQEKGDFLSYLRQL